MKTKAPRWETRMVPCVTADGKIEFRKMRVKETIGVCIINAAGIKHARFKA